MLSLSQGVFYSTTRLPYGSHSYSFVEKYMLVLAKACFTVRVLYVSHSHSFVEKYMLSLSQSVFYSTCVTLRVTFLL